MAKKNVLKLKNDTLLAEISKLNEVKVQNVSEKMRFQIQISRYSCIDNSTNLEALKSVKKCFVKFNLNILKLFKIGFLKLILIFSPLAEFKSNKHSYLLDTSLLTFLLPYWSLCPDRQNCPKGGHIAQFVQP